MASWVQTLQGGGNTIAGHISSEDKNQDFWSSISDILWIEEKINGQGLTRKRLGVVTLPSLLYLDYHKLQLHTYLVWRMCNLHLVLLKFFLGVKELFQIWLCKEKAFLFRRAIIIHFGTIQSNCVTFFAHHCSLFQTWTMQVTVIILQLLLEGGVWRHAC